MTDKTLKHLFLAHGQELTAYLTDKLRNADVAADLVQDVFVRFASQPSTTGIVHDRSYLYRMAHNLAIDHVRRRKRQRTDSLPHDDMEHVPEDGPTPEDTVAGRQRLDTLRQAVAELPALTQRVFVMNRLDGMTYADIAVHLGVSESTVQKHLSKALRHVLHKLKSK